MKKINKFAAIFLAGVMTCTAPAVVMASSTEDQIVEMIQESGVEEMISDPAQVTDIIMYVKGLIDQQQITEDQISTGIDMAAEQFGIALSDGEKDTLSGIAKKMIDMDIDEEQLESTLTNVYDTLESLGIGKEEVKSILQKVIELAKGILN